MKLTEAMAVLDNAGLMPYDYFRFSDWMVCGTTSAEGSFVVCRVKLDMFDDASTVQELDSLGIRIVYILGLVACFEFSEDIEGDAEESNQC